MGALFRDSRHKIERANQYFSELKSAILRLQKDYTSSVFTHTDTGVQELLHQIPNLERSLLKLSLIVGDAVHNLHAALDFAWISTIERNLPGTKTEHSKFPIRKSKKELEDALHGIEIDTTFPTLYRRIMSDIQPYEQGRSGVIYVLHELDILDKHLLLLELTPHAGIRSIVIRDQSGEVFRGSGMTVEGP